MTREDIKKEALDFSKRKYGEEYQYPMAKTQACCWGFINGAEWRINNVWHKPNEEPVSFCSLLLIENSNGEFDLEYKFDPATTKRWAYVKDLIPNMEE